MRRSQRCFGMLARNYKQGEFHRECCLQLILSVGVLLQVKIWFQNRRTKWKKHDNISNAEAAEHKAQQAPQQMVVRKEPGAKSAATPPGRLKPPTGSPSSGDEHSNGSVLTGDGSVSESCFSEPDASRSAYLPPVATSPSTASLSPVVPPAIPLEVRSSSPRAPADTLGNTPALGATAATPPSLPMPAEPEPPSPPLQAPSPPRPPRGATNQILGEEAASPEAAGLEQLTLSPS